MLDEKFTSCEVVGEKKTYKPVWTIVIVEMITEDLGTQHPRSQWEWPSVMRGKVISIGHGTSELHPPAKIWDIVIFPHHSGDKISSTLRVIGFRHILAIEC